MFAVLLLIEKWVPAIKKLPSFLQHFYVLLLVCISFVLFNATVPGTNIPSVAQAGKDLACMFGFGGLPLVSSHAWYYLRSYAVLLIAAIVGATPLVKKLACRVGETKIGAVLEWVLIGILLLVCTAYLVDGSFSPFLYLRF